MANLTDVEPTNAQPATTDAAPIFVDADVLLAPIGGEARPIGDWVTTFHLVMVVLDPYTHESSWIIDTSGRVLRNFVGADCRVSYLVTGTPKEAQEFLGPWATEMLTFADQDRSVVRALGLQALPAIVHLDHQLQVRAQAQGWNPTEWWDFTKQLATAMSWHSPMLPGDGDPPKFAGTAALG